MCSRGGDLSFLKIESKSRVVEFAVAELFSETLSPGLDTLAAMTFDLSDDMARWRAGHGFDVLMERSARLLADILTQQVLKRQYLAGAYTAVGQWDNR